MKTKVLNTKQFTYKTLLIILLTLSGLGGLGLSAQTPVRPLQPATPADSIMIDSLHRKNQTELQLLEAPVDTAMLTTKTDSMQRELPKPKKRFIPNSNRSIWLALVFPGGGQIYNRKYWKLPIVYGGFVGCAYALNWNNKMYKDYSQAYLDIMDDDPNTKSFEDFLPLNSSITGQEERYKEIFRKRKDTYRRQRDLSIFCFIGVYLLSVIDAYVDAELSDFDITKDIGLKVEPTLFNDGRSNNYNSVGLQCSLKF